ncbi:hypothetical protein [Nostoc sp.]
MTDEQVLGAAASLAMLSPMANNDVERHTDIGLKAFTVKHSISD